MSEYSEMLRRRQDAIAAADAEFLATLKALRESCGHEDLTAWLSAYRGEARLCKRCMLAVEKSSDYYPVGMW